MHLKNKDGALIILIHPNSVVKYLNLPMKNTLDFKEIAAIVNDE
jgi:hypothetical protein